jgi:hypothetical protein
MGIGPVQGFVAPAFRIGHSENPPKKLLNVGLLTAIPGVLIYKDFFRIIK